MKMKPIDFSVAEAVAATVIWRGEQKELISRAIARLKTALKYGDDMDSSRRLCIFDAEQLLRKADELAADIDVAKEVR